MALRFNPPPNWPAPPEGFVPPAGWQPDPAWGPAPEGWQLWVDDAAAGGPSASSAPQTSSAADPAWAPTQAVPTGSSAAVADPTGAPVSAPSGDYAASQATQAGVPGQPPMAGSAPTASPYAASMDYAQSPTPYQNMPGQPAGAPPQQAPWQPVDVGQQGTGGATPVTKQWWFWTIIGVVVLALVGTVIFAMSGDDSDDSPRAGGSSSSSAPSSGGDDDRPSDDDSDRPSSSPSPSRGSGGTSGDVGTSLDNPADPSQYQLTLTDDNSYSDTAGSSIDVQLGAVEWDASSTLQAELDRLYDDPGAGNVYMRIPVKVTYHGQGQFDAYDLNLDYINNGTTYERELVISTSEFRSQSMPYDGGTVEGYFTFIVPAGTQDTGVFAISGFYEDPWYMKAV